MLICMCIQAMSYAEQVMWPYETLQEMMNAAIYVLEVYLIVLYTLKNFVLFAKDNIVIKTIYKSFNN